MKLFRYFNVFLLILLIFGCVTGEKIQEKAVDSITSAELKVHLDFLASDEFKGRNTPSQGLKIASRYLATRVESYGLKPLMPDGSFFQKIPLKVSEIDRTRTYISIPSKNDNREFSFPDDFGIYGRSYQDMQISGRVLFAGFGLSAPMLEWDDLKGLDIKGKVVVILDADLPDDHRLKTPENRRRLWRRSRNIGQKGAAAVLIVVSEERENNFSKNSCLFESSRRCRLAEKLKSMGESSTRQSYLRLEIRHNTAAEILGISRKKLSEIFTVIKGGKQVKGLELPGKKIDIAIKVKQRRGSTYNVVAWLEGSDEELKDEYILFGSHHDHLGAREGRVYNGADDNGSGTVAMLEIAQALMITRPKRSAILVWHSAEEKGLWGSRYFVEHSPVPVEKMSGELNMDMISRNDPNSLYLIGSNKLSSELDAVIHRVNDKHFQLEFDYKYEDPKHPDNFFFRSDQFPYIQYGIPGVWFFCGTTKDYHQETDTTDRVNFNKMEKITKLAYLTALEIGNLPEMLKLDLHPEITSRGKHNLKVKWR